MTEGFPLVALPGGNVFFANEDVSTPAREDGSRFISCKPLPGAAAAYDAAKALRYIVRLAEAIDL